MFCQGRIGGAVTRLASQTTGTKPYIVVSRFGRRTLTSCAVTSFSEVKCFDAGLSP
jgi:hypothetical protein